MKVNVTGSPERIKLNSSHIGMIVGRDDTGIGGVIGIVCGAREESVEIFVLSSTLNVSVRPRSVLFQNDGFYLFGGKITLENDQ